MYQFCSVEFSNSKHFSGMFSFRSIPSQNNAASFTTNTTSSAYTLSPPLPDKSILLETVGCSHNILHVAITSCIPTGDKNNKSESSSEQRQGSSATVIGDQGGLSFCFYFFNIQQVSIVERCKVCPILLCFDFI